MTQVLKSKQVRVSGDGVAFGKVTTVWVLAATLPTVAAAQAWVARQFDPTLFKVVV